MNRRQLLQGSLLALLLPTAANAQFWRKQNKKKRVILVWSEGTAPKSVYPDDIRGAVAAALAKLPGGYEIKTATLSDPEQGIAELDKVDVLFWWGHQKHGNVTDATVDKIVARVKDGMGFVALHSSHYAKPFKAVVAATGSWREYVDDGKPERVKVVDPKHPLVKGVTDFVLPKEERYEEPFEVPKPDAAPLEALYDGTGNTARQLLTWTIGKGRVVYFRPGHEGYPTYYLAPVVKLLRNMALFAAHDEKKI